jgi:hypothetical protein
MRLRLASVVGLVTLLVSSATALSPRAEAAPAAPALPSDQALVWTTDADDHSTTQWIAPAATAPGYRVVAESPGVLVAAGANVWRWTARTEKVATGPCTTFTIPPGDGSGTRAAVERLGAHERLTLATPPRGGAAVNVVLHEAQPIASLGPYLFVRETTYLFACGGVAVRAAGVTVWDLASRRRSDLLTRAERGALDGTSRLEAQAVLPPFQDPLKPEDVIYRGSLPHFDERGALRIDHAFTTFACYACSDVVWGSYTVSTEIPARSVPERARPYAATPPVVAAWAAAHPGITIRGWSSVSALAARTLAGAMK